MTDRTPEPAPAARRVPIAVVMISLNEGHNMESVLRNIGDWAQEVFVLDSFSSDRTVEIALSHGAFVGQRAFRGFGDQWNFALEKMPIRAPWTMKLDPDERLSDELKEGIRSAVERGEAAGLSIVRRLWFMGAPLPVRQTLLRVWRTGTCRFTDVLVNEHPVVDGPVKQARGELEHYDSPDLFHWYDKQNRYSTTEALTTYKSLALAAPPRLFGTRLERRMWLKRNFWRVPGRFVFMYLYHLLWLGAWRAGRPGRIWARLRAEIFRMQEYKLFEMRRLGRAEPPPPAATGKPDSRAVQYD